MNFFKELSLDTDLSTVSTGSSWYKPTSDNILCPFSPVDGSTYLELPLATEKEYNTVLETASAAFPVWRDTPAPVRGEIVRQIGVRLRDYKIPLGKLISYETGKPLQEGLGEVQEAIDVCDFALGQSRMLYGMTTVSERPMHKLYDQYHPLGIVGVITAFNFPLAVYSWNTMLAAVCGDVIIWKPSSKAPATAMAMQKILGEVVADYDLPEGIFNLLVGGRDDVGNKMLGDSRIPLISFTGSVASGKHAAEIVARRLGRTILELGGNNAIIIAPSADLKLAIPSVVFGSVGTTGQRCTSTRRLIIHESVYQEVVTRLQRAYESLNIGDPLDETNHVGPLIDLQSVHDFRESIEAITGQDGRILHGGTVLFGPGYESGCYVEPTLAEVEVTTAIVQEETFAPILYLMKYSGDIDEAIAIQNGVRQGLSSAVFTTDLRESERFLSAAGSDCGLANVNIGTSGAEIGGAFGGEKETGGGRESGSDAWKAYMRRQTVTVNYGSSLPLAQGINFDIG
ncbi:aldehyde dehydrogenase family protein [Desulfosediminicola sp.]|uniref:L-piperidine-6-carboxylate dehydrogenase n=1 Tax=Desulfosediminicola sp. TaxID=2886825 RepID=UPI003AF20CFD